MKKLKTAAVAVSFLLCSFAVPAEARAEEIPVVYINAGYGGENDIAEVELNIKNNSGISAYSIEVDFDSQVLRFIDAKQGDAIDGGTFYCNGTYAEDAVRIVWSDSRNQKGDGTAAVLRFKTANGTAETNTAVSLGYSILGDDLNELPFEASDGELKIAGEIKRGDVNGDGRVNVADVVAVNMYLLNSEKNPLSNTLQANAEVTGDKIVDTADSGLIMNYASMMIGEL